MPHHITARLPRLTAMPRVENDAAIVASFLSDAAHVPGGYASGVSFPTSEGEVSALVARADRVLPVGAQSSLTGGATPRGDIVLSTRALRQLSPAVSVAGTTTIRVGAGVPLAELQRHLSEAGFYYPPVPTFDGAFVGGTISTNAAGAATFKYGSTRPWVEAITVVLADGCVLDLERGQVTASPEGHFAIARPSGGTTSVPVPTYTMPDVAKLSAGYFARPGMDLVDLFVGSEGTLGIVIDAALRVIPLPRRCAALVPCEGDDQAVRVTAALRAEALEAWRGRGPLDIAAIEFMDARALAAVGNEPFVRAGIDRPPAATVLLLLQIEVRDDDDAALSRLAAVLEQCEVAADARIAAPGDSRGMQRFFELREAVPAGVNAIVAAAKKRAHPDIEKTAGDMVVPFERLGESLALYRREFAARDIDYAIWGHVSDGNLHANVVPRSLDDVIRGREALIAMARGVIAMGGAPLAEHGVGRSAMKQQLLRELYGDAGIAAMQAVKRALDPGWKLSPGVLFPPT